MRELVNLSIRFLFLPANIILGLLSRARQNELKIWMCRRNSVFSAFSIGT